MISAEELELRKIKLQEAELRLKEAQLASDFAKFGFRGTLGGAIGGMILILAIRIVDLYSKECHMGFKGIIGLTVLIVIPVIVFGAFSIKQPIRVMAKLSEKVSLGVDVEQPKSNNHNNPE